MKSKSFVAFALCLLFLGASLPRGLKAGDGEEGSRFDHHAVLVVAIQKDGATSYEVDDLRLGREFDLLTYSPTKLSSPDYFKQVLEPKFEALEDVMGPLDQLRQALREFKRSPLGEVSWDIYSKEHWREFEEHLPKGANYSTQILMTYDWKDGGVFPMKQSLEKSMLDAGANLQLIAGDLHMALYSWVKTQEPHKHDKLYGIIPRLVAHLMSDEDGDTVADWYETPNKLERPTKKPIEINAYEFIDAFVTDEAAADKLMADRCEEWKISVVSKLTPKADVSAVECRPLKVRGGRFIDVTTKQLVTDGRSQWYQPRTEKKWEWGFISNIVGKAKLVPPGYAKVVSREIYSYLMPADSRPGETIPTFESAKAQFQMCQEHVRNDVTLFGSFHFFGYCPVDRQSLDYITFKNLSLPTGESNTSSGRGYDAWKGPSTSWVMETRDVTVGYASKVGVDLILVSKHRIESKTQTYSANGDFPKDFLGNAHPDFVNVDTALKALEEKFQELKAEQRANKKSTFLAAFPYGRENCASRSVSFGNVRSGNFTVSATAEFLSTRR